MIRKLSGIIFGVAIPFFFLLTITQFVIQWDYLYISHYENYNVDKTTTIDMDELMYITDEIQEYLLGDRKDFAIVGVVGGVEKQVFNEREIVHMDDVKVLFDKGILIRNLCGILAAGIGVFLWKRSKQTLYRYMKFSSIGFLSIGTILAILFISNFNKYFNLFHEIFFNNDYWILDPNDSVLINMVNLEFFSKIAGLILAISTVSMILIGTFGFIMQRKEGNYEG